MSISETMWTQLKIFINNLTMDAVITRQELFNKLGIPSCLRNPHTLDTYRRSLQIVGVLETMKPGVYIKKKNIRSDISVSELREIAYGKSWKSWFIQVDS